MIVSLGEAVLLPLLALELSIYGAMPRGGPTQGIRRQQHPRSLDTYHLLQNLARTHTADPPTPLRACLKTHKLSARGDCTHARISQERLVSWSQYAR